MTAIRLREEHLVLLLILAAAALRLAPHPENITPIGALALFSGACLSRRLLWMVPLGALLLGDAAAGFYNLTVMAWVYLGFAASATLGRWLLVRSRTPMRLAAAVVAGAMAFWLISNLVNWLVFRPLTVAGLLQCYSDGLPYLGRSLVGDALYTTGLFGSYAVLRRVPMISRPIPQRA